MCRIGASDQQTDLRISHRCLAAVIAGREGNQPTQRSTDGRAMAVRDLRHCQAVAWEREGKGVPAKRPATRQQPRRGGVLRDLGWTAGDGSSVRRHRVLLQHRTRKWCPMTQPGQKKEPTPATPSLWLMPQRTNPRLAVRRSESLRCTSGGNRSAAPAKTRSGPAAPSHPRVSFVCRSSLRVS